MSNTSHWCLTADLTWFPLGHARKSSILPRLLDENDPRGVRLLHRGAHLTVPHAHRCFWEVVAQLQNIRKEVYYPQYFEALQLTQLARKGINSLMLCLPCRGFLLEVCQLVASCWGWQGTCCTGFKTELYSAFKAKLVTYMIEMLLGILTH